MKAQGDENDGHSVCSNENCDEPAERMTWEFHDLRGDVYQDVPALRAIR